MSDGESETAKNDAESAEQATTSENETTQSENTGENDTESAENSLPATPDNVSDDQATLDSLSDSDGTDTSQDGDADIVASTDANAESTHNGLTPPTPPAELPQYLVDPLQRQSLERLRETADFIDELIEFASQTQNHSDDVDVDELENIDREELQQMDDEELEEKGSIVERRVKCGRDECRCSSGDEDEMHGPYKYLYYRNSKGEVANRYIEKVAANG